jgi:hypothetical protein
MFRVYNNEMFMISKARGFCIHEEETQKRSSKNNFSALMLLPEEINGQKTFILDNFTSSNLTPEKTINGLHLLFLSC